MPKTTDPARDLLSFIDASPSPYHATAEIVRRLGAHDFSALDEKENWELRPGDRRFVVRDASIAAFVMGTEPAAEAGFLLVGAHTDSPCLRVKPNPSVVRHGYALLGCEVYGGALFSTWMDRDLGLAGRVSLRGKKKATLVNFKEPILRIPNLAIHLHRLVNTDGLKLNPQTQMVPVLSLVGKHAPDVVALVAKQIGVKASEVVGLDLCLASTEASTLGGLDNEFIFAPRLDNLASCHAGLSALLAAPRKHDATRLLVCYDHEEVGSLSANGAQSPFLRDILQRITAASDSDAGVQGFARAMAQSFCISADMAHAGHPNYAELSEPEHMPILGRGPVVKTNASQRYATSGATAARFEACAERAKVKVQRFVTRNDLACGSTIGPITAGELGVPTVDVGNPMLSMHSIREMAAASDVGDMIAVLGAFFAAA